MAKRIHSWHHNIHTWWSWPKEMILHILHICLKNIYVKYCTDYKQLCVMATDNKGDYSIVTLYRGAFTVKFDTVKNKKAQRKCNNLIRVLTSCHTLPPSIICFSTQLCFTLPLIHFYFISPCCGASYVSPSLPHSLTTAQRGAKPGKYWQGAPVTRREPVNAQTPRAGVNDKR